ncbi:MAG: hypothetical protein A2167_05510 [Planctomycetes bacterium RBG_13_46_10]|nr:MAG: hypothetical protein A2167_05510 [Planctomycetes bacterium RBG_13_46_10]
MDKLEPKQDKILRQLLALRKKEVIQMASEFTPPVEGKQSWNSRQWAFAIRRRQLLQLRTESNAAQDAAQVRDRKPEFEEAVGGEGLPPLEDQPAERRGGVRPGAGRPPGSTAEHVQIKRVMSIAQPNETIKGAYEIGFSVLVMKIEQLAPILTPERAAELALPATKLCEYYYKDQIPEELLMWLEFSVIHGVLLTEIAAVLRDIRSGKLKTETKDNADSRQQDSDRQDGQRQNGQG